MIKMGDKRGQKFVDQAKMFDDHKMDLRFAQDNDMATLGSEITDLTRMLSPNAAGKIVDSDGNEMSQEKYTSLYNRLDVISKVYNARVKALKDDPAAAADAGNGGLSPDVPMPVRIAARIDYQKSNGVKPSAIRPLTKNEEEHLVEQYQNTKQPAQFISAVMDAYGNQAQAVMRQLVASGKLPENFNLIKDMAPGDGNLLAMTGRKGWVKDTEETLPADFKKKDFGEAVRMELAPVMSTLLVDNESPTAKMIQDSTYRMALAYKQQGMDDAAAIKKAAGAVINDRYTVKGSMRIPKRFDADRVEKGATDLLSDIRIDTLQPMAVPTGTGLSQESIDRRYREMLRSKGKWVVLGDESGVMLTVAGRAVKDRNGKPVTRKFEDLENYTSIYESDEDDEVTD